MENCQHLLNRSAAVLVPTQFWFLKTISWFKGCFSSLLEAHCALGSKSPDSYTTHLVSLKPE